MRPVLYAGPWSTAGRPVDTPLTITGTGAWVLVSAPHQPEVAGAWVGVEISAYPTGPAWADIPHGTTTGAVELLLTTVPSFDTSVNNFLLGNRITAHVSSIATGLRCVVKNRTSDGRPSPRRSTTTRPAPSSPPAPGSQQPTDPLESIITIPFTQPLHLAAGQVVVATGYIPTGTGTTYAGYVPVPNAVNGVVTSIAAGGSQQECPCAVATQR